MTVTPVQVGQWTVGGGSPLLWICGPCVIEGRDFTLRVADVLRKYAGDLGLQLVFKASFDKANRTSGKSFRGPGLEEGLKILERGPPGHRSPHHHRRARVPPGRPCCGSLRGAPGPGVPGATDRPS